MEKLAKLSPSLKSISSTDSNILATSYIKVECNIVECAKILHTIIFTEYPKLPGQFPFVGTELDTFRRHCTLFLRRIAVMVKHSSDIEYVEPILRKLAETHHTHKVNQTSLEQMRLCFLEALRRHMTDDVFTNDVFLVWDSVTRESFKYIMKLVEIFREEEEAKEEAKVIAYNATPKIPDISQAKRRASVGKVSTHTTGILSSRSKSKIKSNSKKTEI